MSVVSDEQEFLEAEKVSLAIVIVAVDDGVQFKSKRPKVLHEIGGKPLLAHVIAAANQIVAPADIFVVVGHEAARIESALASIGVNFVLPSERPGAGYAIQSASKVIADYHDVLVLRGDAPLIRPETLAGLVKFHQNQNAALTKLTNVTATANPGGIEPLDTGISIFKTKALLAHLGELPTNDTQDAYLTTEMMGIFVSAGEHVVSFETQDAAETRAVSTIAELVALDAVLRARTTARLMAEGVTIFRPETCVIDADVEIGPDTIIEPYVQLLGKTRIGSDCLIRSSTVIENSTLADNVLVRQSCVITESEIETGAKIGPFAHLRPGSEIGEEAHVGNFVETKKARLGKGAKAGHLTYLGDAEIGAGTNIGAGVITCNYDGVNKHRTKIGAGAFVGSDSTLVAPISIGDGAYIGAGSCITKEVPANALAVGRARQITKEGWATARRERRQKECES
jgi:bifunctional UDP-N-acetylglucosamine pyrophosphorylase/glucosamine-1-phosphate N-acetyltransferase